MDADQELPVVVLYLRPHHIAGAHRDRDGYGVCRVKLVPGVIHRGGAVTIGRRSRLLHRVVAVAVDAHPKHRGAGRRLGAVDLGDVPRAVGISEVGAGYSVAAPVVGGYAAAREHSTKPHGSVLVCGYCRCGWL